MPRIQDEETAIANRRSRRIRAIANAGAGVARNAPNPAQVLHRGPTNAGEPLARLTIRLPALQACTLCEKGFRAFAHIQAQNPIPDRCSPCQYLEKCSMCKSRKQRSHFYRSGEVGGDLWMTCKSCRDKSANRVLSKREAAQAKGDEDECAPLLANNVNYPSGLHYCTIANHEATLQECTNVETGQVTLNCQDCLKALRDKRTQMANGADAAAEALTAEEQAAGHENAQGIAIEDIDEYDAIYGDNEVFMNLDLPQDSVLDEREAALMRDFEQALDAIKLESCNSCLEESFDLEVVDGTCKSCRNNNGAVKKWSLENNTQPALDVPNCLKGMTEVEEMLIARTKTFMQVRHTSGKQLSYKEHIVNYRQDIGELAHKLPRMPEHISMVVVRKANLEMDQHVDFLVRREKVREALEWKILNDPHYSDLQIDQEVLAGLPARGSVAHRVPWVPEEPANANNLDAVGQGPNDAAGQDPGNVDGNDADEQLVMGVVDAEGVGGTEAEEIRRAAAEVVERREAPYQQEIVNAPEMDATPLSEYTAGYIPLAFPTLFPDGKGDYHQPRQQKVELGEYFAHLLQFRGGRFAQHKRFPWFAFNTLQRHRTRERSKIFVRQHHDEAQMTAEQIEELLREGDNSLVNKMMRFGEDLRGTRAYWLARRKELVDALKVKDTPHIFFTLSAADLQWPDMHRHMPGHQPEDPKAAFRHRFKSVNNNPHIAAAYIDQRIQAYMKHFLCPLLGVEDYWYRYEWQERGTGHVHGFLWLKNAPNPESIDWDLLKDPDNEIPLDQQQKMEAWIQHWDKVITATNPLPETIPTDNQPLPGLHPCSLPREGFQHTKEELANLLNWVERHNDCRAGYCLMHRKNPGQGEPQAYCRFGYPHPERESPCVGLDMKKRLQFEPTRNDSRMNTHNRPAILAWRANLDFKPVLSKDAAINYAAKYATKAEKNAPAFSELLRTIIQNDNAEMSAQSACQKLLNKMLGERAYPAQEVAHLLLSIPLVRSTFSWQTLSLSPNGSFRRVERQQPVREANLQHGDSDEPVTDESWIQRYVARPEALTNLSLHGVMTRYRWKKGKWTKRTRDSNTIADNKVKTILRVYPRYPPNPDGADYEEYCRVKVTLHHAFRNVEELRAENQTWSERFSQCRVACAPHPRDTLRCWEEENRPSEEEEDDGEDELVNADVVEWTDADWQVWLRMRPGNDVPTYGLDDLGKRPLDDGWDLDASRERWDNVESMATYIDQQKRLHGQESAVRNGVNIAALSVEQRAVYDAFVNAYNEILANGALPQQALLNIDGTAGCGKTYTIDAICQTLRQMAADHGQPIPYRVLAPSGVAALNIGGSTIHSGLFVPTGTNFNPLEGTRLGSFQQAWAGVHFIIVDEKSMVGLKLLAKMDSRCRQICPANSEQRFGGLHVGLFGDFAQLPAVGDSPLYSPPPAPNAAGEADDLKRAGYDTYRAFVTSYQLTHVYRQEGDDPITARFRQLLMSASNGRLTVEDWQLLASRCVANVPANEQAIFDDAVCLQARTEDVMQINLQELKRLNEPCARIKARHDGGRPAERAESDQAGGLQKDVLLSRRSKVMLTRNLWLQQGLVNGTVGFVEDVVWAPGASRSDVPIAVLVSCKTYKGPTLWKTVDNIPIIPIPPSKFSFEAESKQCSRTQIPLRLAWAVTIHKSQGLTLGQVKLGLGKKEFATGLTFVGLSRVKTLDSLLITDALSYSRVERLGGKYLRYRLDDFARRYPLAAQVVAPQNNDIET